MNMTAAAPRHVGSTMDIFSNATKRQQMANSTFRRESLAFNSTEHP